MNFLQAIILGIIQGLTEWLPVSSSGHLVIFQELLNMKASLAFDLAVHIGTLLVVFVYFWKDITRIVKAVGTWDFESEHFRLGIFIILASLVTGLFGWIFYDQVSAVFTSSLIVGILLVFNGLFLIYINKKEGWAKVGWLNSLIIGFGQAIAILPGISRSGATIGAALMSDVKRDEAFRFSFLLSIPAVIGANLYSFRVSDFAFDVNVLAGILAAFLAGYIALLWLKSWLRKSRLKYFGYYCIIVGLLAVVFSLI